MRDRIGAWKALGMFLLLGGVGCLIAGCDSSTEGGPYTYTVQYVVEGEVLAGGSTLVEHVFFDDETGNVEIELVPPEEDWSRTVTLVSGDSIFLRAEGTTDSGRIRLQISVQADNGAFFVRTADTMPFGDGSVWIQIDREILP